jgi:phosphatidate phosphatase APP1
LGLFFVGNSVKVATKSIINGVEHLLQPPDESGFIEEQLELSDHEIKSLCSPIYSETNDQKFDYEIKINESKTDVNYKSFKCTIYVLAPYGVSIISDIDDTIKITKVLSKPALLKHTFYSYFKPVDGMNELYQIWYTQNCQFHYVSSSPWQLYPALRCFLEKYQYPIGTMNLRKFTWSLKFLKPPDTYKIEIITQIINSYPARKYICVGDSGELDPEIYSKLFIIYPHNIAHIFIRDICALSECLPTCQERYEKAFKDVPRERWTVFKDPNHVQTNIQELIGM